MRTESYMDQMKLKYYTNISYVRLHPYVEHKSYDLRISCVGFTNFYIGLTSSYVEFTTVKSLI